MIKTFIYSYQNTQLPLICPNCFTVFSLISIKNIPHGMQVNPKTVFAVWIFVFDHIFKKVKVYFGSSQSSPLRRRCNSLSRF